MSSTRGTIALVNVINSDSVLKLRIPVALIYLGSALRKNGFDVEIHQPIDRPEDIGKVEKKIVDSDPLFVGFSVFMGSGSVRSLDMSSRLKAACDAKIVWGGKFPTSISRQVIEEKCIDAVCIGEGEHTVVEIAEALEKGTDFAGIKGICYKQGGKAVYTERKDLICDLDSLDYDLSLIENWERYMTLHDGSRTLLDVIESQRGCPFRCAFCYHSIDIDRDIYDISSKRAVRRHSVDWTIDKALKLKALTGVEYISFCDDEFWIDRDRSFDILDKLSDAGIYFYKLRMRFSSLKNEEMIQRLIDYRIRTLNFGLESGVDRILKLMNKNLTTREAVEKVGFMAKYPRIAAGAPIIICCPTDTKAEMVESILFGVSLCRINPNFTFGVNIYKPLPGTVFFKLAVESGFKPPEDIRGWVNVEHKSIHKLVSSWLPWFDTREERNYLRLQEYLPILQDGMKRTSKIGSNGSKEGMVKNMLWRFLVMLIGLRIKKWFFLFPVELRLIRSSRRLRGLDMEDRFSTSKSD